MKLVSSFLRENALFLVLLSGVALAYILLRQGPSSVASLDELDAYLGSGRPVVVEFYSDT